MNIARERQVKRYKDERIYSNSMLSPKNIKKYCLLDKAEDIIKEAFKNLNLAPEATIRY